MTVEAYEQAQKDQRISQLKWELANAADAAIHTIQQLKTDARCAEPSDPHVKQLRDQLELLLLKVQLLEAERPPHGAVSPTLVPVVHDEQLIALQPQGSTRDGFAEALPRLLKRA
jgi:hypothetical protein